MTKPLDFIVYIGRFQPFHVGHKSVIDYALTQAEKVIVLIGSANLHRSTKNIFTADERINMIRCCFDKRWRDKEISLNTASERIIFGSINDYPYNETAWLTSVNEVVNDIVSSEEKLNNRLFGSSTIGIIGYSKDVTATSATSFPQWEPVDMSQRIGTINATDIRLQYLRSTPIISEFLPDEVRTFMRVFAMTPEFNWLVNEQKFLDEYNKTWGKGPFVTADAVVEQSGHILLVERKHPPYAGALALPGGFLNTNKAERIIDAAVRELKEETRIADDRGEIPPAMLKSFIKNSCVFDDPERDPRARIITHAYHFELPKRSSLFQVRGDDDAASAKWYNLGELSPDMLMADHWFIIQHFLDINWK